MFSEDVNAINKLLYMERVSRQVSGISIGMKNKIQSDFDKEIYNYLPQLRILLLFPKVT